MAFPAFRLFFFPSLNLSFSNSADSYRSTFCHCSRCFDHEEKHLARYTVRPCTPPRDNLFAIVLGTTIDRLAGTPITRFSPLRYRQVPCFPTKLLSLEVFNSRLEDWHTVASETRRDPSDALPSSCFYAKLRRATSR